MARQLTPAAHGKIWAHYMTGLNVFGIMVETGYAWTTITNSLMKNSDYFRISDGRARNYIFDPYGSGVYWATRQQPYYENEEAIRQHCKTRFQWAT